MIGVDIVAVSRIRELSDGVKAKIFHPDELAYAAEVARSAETLAGRFAAREALGKALGCGVIGLHSSRLCVTNSESGAPVFVEDEYFKSVVARYAEKCREVNLSIAHEKEYAVAVVEVICGEK